MRAAGVLTSPESIMLNEAKRLLESYAKKVPETQQAVAQARAAVESTRAALVWDEKLTKDQVEERETAYHRAQSALALAETAERKATAAHAEAQARVARLAPHAIALTKLSRLYAAIKTQDAAISDLGPELYARVATPLRDLRRLITEAEAVFNSLPVEVRCADLTVPAAAAETWGGASEGQDLLRHLSAALYARLGRFPGPAGGAP
jgi:hypothetical protein